MSPFTQADVDNGLVSYHETGSTASSDSFTFKVTDAAGNQTAAQQFQFQISPVVTVIQTDTNTFGSTSLVEVGNDYFLYPAGGTTGPELQYAGAPITAGEFGNWTLIGAVATASGYDIAWHEAGTDDYQISICRPEWQRFLRTAVLSGSSYTLECLRTVFNQDLNGDGADRAGWDTHPDRHRSVWNDEPYRSRQQLRP